jgi:hypothetical protein
MTLQQTYRCVSRFYGQLPCARITSIRFKGTFSVETGNGLNTPSECALFMQHKFSICEVLMPLQAWRVARPATTAAVACDSYATPHNGAAKPLGVGW